MRNRRERRIAGVVALLAALATAACPSGHDQKQPGSPGDTRAVSVSSFDEFNKDLAKRVTDVLVPGGAPDFQVVVTPAMDPIGTLYRKGRSVPYDDKACVPAVEPGARSMPSMFPSYQLDAKVAADFGLDESILRGVANLGAGISTGSSFNFSVLNAQLKALSDRAIQDVLMASSCAMATQGEMVIVRGYVNGQRRFSTKGDGSAKISATAAKVGKFNVEGTTAGLVSITDDAPQAFLQILSAVTTAPVHPADPAVPPTHAPNVSAPQAATGEGQVYVQQDRADDAAKGKAVLNLLRGSGFKVENRVEQVASAATPDRPQVRYFNEGDKDRAATLADRLRQQYPDVKLVPLKIPAPKGQLEVWLPRANQ